MKKTRLGIMVGLIAFGLAASLFAAVIGEEDIGVSGDQDLDIRVSEDGEQPKEPQYAPGEVLVKFKEGVNPSAVLKEVNIEPKSTGRIYSIKPAVAKFKKDYKLEKDSKGSYPFLGKNYKEVTDIPDDAIFKEAYNKMPEAEKALYRTYKLNLPEGITVEEAISKLKNNPNVEYAEPNSIVKVQMVPTDPYYSSQGSWGQPYDDLWGLKKIQCEQAWDISQGEGVVVAVIDTGVDYNHPDLAANIWANPNEIPGNGIDDDNNGYIDDVKGWDFAYADNDPMDGFGHGTHCAGTIAAIGNNNTGVIGVAPRAKIMTIKGLNDSGSGYIDQLAQCVIYAADNGAKVLSNSWGGRGTSQTLIDAFHHAYDAGCICIASAGNSNADVSGFTPANIDTVIAVAASTQRDEKCSFSNYGYKIDVAAPGGGYVNELGHGRPDIYNILSTMGDNVNLALTHPELKVAPCYYRLAGTSMACPHVSGLAALIVSLYPALTNNEIKYRIVGSSDEISDKTIGNGRINTQKALQMQITAGINAPLINETVSGSIEIHGYAAGAAFHHYELWNWPLENPSAATLFQSSTSQVTNGILGVLDTCSSQEGTRVICLKVFDNNGDCARYRVIVTVDNVEIISPHALEAIGTPLINIIGNANKANFSQYQLFIKEGFLEEAGAWTTNGITLANDGTIPVQNSLLATLDTSIATHSSIYTLKLSINNDEVVDYRTFYIEKDYKPNFPIQLFEPGSDLVCASPKAGDLDNDGRNEIVVLSVCGRVFVVNPDSTIRWQRDISDGQHIQLYSAPAIGDINGDGFSEIVIETDSKYNPSAGRAERCVVALDMDGNVLNGFPVFLSGGIVDIGNQWDNRSSPLLLDVNDDGILDIISITDFSALNGMSVDAISGTGDILWQKLLGGVTGWWNANGSPACGDIDGDGETEIIIQGYYGRIVLPGTEDQDRPLTYYLWAIRKDGTIMPGWPYILIPPTCFSGSYGVYQEGPILADINHDGKCEILSVINVGRGEGDPPVSDIPFVYVVGCESDSSPILNWSVSGRSVGSIWDFYTINASAICDIDNDGEMEIIFSLDRELGCNPYLFVLSNTGSVKPGWPILLRQSSGYPYSYNFGPVSAIDIDNNNMSELFLPNILPKRYTPGAYPSFDIYAFNYDGADIPRQNPKTPVPGWDPKTMGARTRGSLCFSDLEQDGILEAICISKGGKLCVWQMPNGKVVPLRTWSTRHHDNRNTRANVNNSPILNQIGHKILNEGQELRFSISAQDPDGDTLTYFASNLPTGASFIGRTFNWTPTYEQAGIYNVAFSVSDGELTDSETIIIIVNNVNGPPVLNPIGDKVVKEGSLLQFTISARDPDHDPLTYSASNLPQGATFNATTHTFTWTPTYDQAGTYKVAFTVRDTGGLTASETVTITVKNVNRPPVLDPIGDKVVNEGSLLQFTISARDPDRDPITYSATNLPNGARINSRTGQFTWTPTYDQAGTYTVTFIASDGTLSDKKRCIIKVNNVPMPDLTTGAITYTVSGNGLYTFTAPIKNIGDKAVKTPFYVYFYVDGKETGSRILSYISPGQTITVHFPWPGVKGDHVIKITADATNRIKEADENNNSAQIRVVVK